MLARSLLSTVACLLTATQVTASIFTYKPVTADSFKAGNSWTVSWYADSGDHAKDLPLAKSFGQTSVSIYSGSSSSQVLRQHLSNLDPSKTTQLRIEVDPKIGPDGDDYFIRFESLNAKDSKGVPLLAFSGSFSLTGMTGTKASTVANTSAAAANDQEAASSSSATVTRAASSGVVKVVATSSTRSTLASGSVESGSIKNSSANLATVSKSSSTSGLASVASLKPSASTTTASGDKKNETSGTLGSFVSNSQTWIGTFVAATVVVVAL
ncbi:hypothetical protein OIO90_002925 [Microbotryomycetes sp. JL221]|nr:hypothetical protein OIO90_002925 [Microbotryomycetes sp. JL221]